MENLLPVSYLISIVIGWDSDRTGGSHAVLNRESTDMDPFKVTPSKIQDQATLTSEEVSHWLKTVPISNNSILLLVRTKDQGKALPVLIAFATWLVFGLLKAYLYGELAT